MRRVQDLLARAVERPEMVRAAKARKVLRRWNEAVGETLAVNTQPDRYDDGAVWVAATGSAWAQELRLRQDVVLSRLNEMAGEPGLFRSLRVGTREPRGPI